MEKYRLLGVIGQARPRIRPVRRNFADHPPGRAICRDIPKIAARARALAGAPLPHAPAPGARKVT